MNEESWMDRPVTMCPDCAGELDLTAADPGDSIDPPEVEPVEEDL